MAQPRTWTFTQLGGDKTVLKLNGYSAPFGRPRLGTLVNSGVKMRTSVTYYPGKSAPTVHVFGVERKPWTLHGRWMDQAIGIVGGARLTARAWKDFVEGAQIVRAQWGELLSCQIFVDEFDIEWESDAECAWKLNAITLTDDSDPVTISIPTVRHPQDISADLQRSFQIATLQTPPTNGLLNALAMLPEISDRIDAIVSLANTPAAIIDDVSAGLSDFTSALSTDLNKLAGAGQQVTTGLLSLRDCTDNLVIGAAQLQDQYANYAALGAAPLFSAADMADMRTQKSQADAETTNYLALVADLLSQIDAVKRGMAQSVIVAADGDTWESLAWRAMGTVDGARALKSMNGVVGGAPIPGKQYIVPRSA